jgi:PPM family protein phosphatase
VSVLVKVYKATDVGPVRKMNEDSLISIIPDTYIVADGMGGHAAGEIASHLLIKTAQDFLRGRDIVYSELLLKEIILKANDAILAASERHSEYMGMGTTATIFHREGTLGVWAHVGDSRLYVLQNGVLKQITQDHSLVEDLVRNGTITEEQARTHPHKNVLTRAVGVDEELLVDMGNFAMQKGDKILLCTDGLTNVLRDEEIQDVLQEQASVDKAEVLVAKALAAGGLDNITAIVVEYDEK